MKRKSFFSLVAIIMTLMACNHTNTSYHSKADSTNMTMRHDTGNTPNDSDMSKMKMDTTGH